MPDLPVFPSIFKCQHIHDLQLVVMLAIVNSSTVYIIYYTPFPCMYQQCEGLFQAKSGYAVERHIDDATKPLAKYGAHAVFYVVGHGDKFAGELSCDCGKCGSNLNMGGGLTPSDLWKRLKDDGLPSNPTAIRLWACRGADAPVEQPEGMSFAATFNLMMEYDDEFLTERTSLSSFNGYLTMTGNGGYSYLERENDATRVAAMKRHVTIKRGSVEREAKAKRV